MAFGASILGYRVWLSLRTEFGLQARDIAVLSSEKVIQNIDLIAAGAGISSLFDFDRAQTLVRQKGEAYAGMLLVVLGTISSLAGLLLRREDANAMAIAAGAVAGVALSAALSKVCSDLLRRFKAQAWLDHGWLEWLENQVPDPLDPVAGPAQNLVVVAQASPHPDLESSLSRNGPMTTEMAEATELWVAGLAKMRDHRFRSDAWRRWCRKMRPALVAPRPEK